ncbi:alpha/beta hydrolase [Pedobacter sp. PLR]|uniref:alpha/beta hydrolase family protein n=1 Tax=Pedobacter sp. PLR TaxID=2994465 RepID=UPI0022479DEB|nr:alpha/beta hydrolase [Pedobacter sp. PLR]MCX2454367.1 alpha/beta hydrolase [Pedobacter sp. PLR]
MKRFLTAFTFCILLYSCNNAPSPRPQDPTSFPYKQKEVLISNTKSKVQLAGTLTIPSNNKVSKIVIMITGSGPQNRNGEGLNHRPFLVWSDWLTRNGIAVLRYDDRGVGRSTGNFSTATTFDFADDVESAVSFIRSRPDLNQLSIGLIGQSEGGLIAPMVASRNNDVKFIVLLAGDGIPIYQVGLQQSADMSRAAGVSEAIIAKKLALDKKFFDLTLQDSSASIGQLKNGIDSLLYQEMLSQHWDTAKFSAYKQRYDHLATPWQRTFLKLKPADYLVKVKCPVLALNGTKDLMVNCKANLAGIAKALDRGGNKQYKIIALKGLNHLFQKAKTGSMTEFAQISETVNPIALTTVSKWINTLSF